MKVTNFVGADVTRSDYIKELIYEYLTNPRKQEWLDVHDPLHLTFVLREYLFRVTFEFTDRYDFCDFMREVTVLRGGNPFVLRFCDAYVRENYRMVFKYMKPRNFVRKYRPLLHQAAIIFLKRRINA